MNKIKITTACGVYFNDSLLMIREKQDGREVIDIPAGGLDPYESIIDGVKREVLEETGVNLQNPVLKGVFQVIEADRTTINFLFTETLLEHPTFNSSESVEDEDILKIKFVPIKEIQDKIISHPELFEHTLALKRLEALFTKDVLSNPILIAE
ncbi:MAG: NUDIX domain-containing protein [Patescibacteria group bacterium]